MEKEPIKIKLSTAILVFIILVLIAGIAYFAIQNNDLKNKQEQNLKGIQNSQSTVEKTYNTANVPDVTNIKAEDENKNNEIFSNTSEVQVDKRENVNEIIKTEIKKKEFLLQNNIKEKDVTIFECRVVENEENPIYIVSVDYQAENNPEHGKIFQATYKDGKVIFDVIEDHKYMSDTIEFDSNKKVLKLSATYHGGTRMRYFSMKNGKFELANEEYEKSEEETTSKDENNGYRFKEVKSIEI